MGSRSFARRAQPDGARPDLGPPAEGRGPRARWWWTGFVVALGGAATWWALHPEPLPRGDQLSLTTPVGVPAYVGVVDVPDGRQVAVRDVAPAPAGVAEEGDLDVLVCRDGAIGATRSLAPFCDAVDDAAGATLDDHDQLVLRVVPNRPGRIAVEGLRLSYRDGWQWGTQRVGPDVVVTAVER